MSAVDLRVGQIFHLEAEGVFGRIIRVECNADGHPCAIVVEGANGFWTVDLTKCADMRPITLH